MHNTPGPPQINQPDLNPDLQFCYLILYAADNPRCCSSFTDPSRAPQVRHSSCSGSKSETFRIGQLFGMFRSAPNLNRLFSGSTQFLE